MGKSWWIGNRRNIQTWEIYLKLEWPWNLCLFSSRLLIPGIMPKAFPRFSTPSVLRQILGPRIQALWNSSPREWISWQPSPVTKSAGRWSCSMVASRLLCRSCASILTSPWSRTWTRVWEVFGKTWTAGTGVLECSGMGEVFWVFCEWFDLGGDGGVLALLWTLPHRTCYCFFFQISSSYWDLGLRVNCGVNSRRKIIVYGPFHGGCSQSWRRNPKPLIFWGHFAWENVGLSHVKPWHVKETAHFEATNDGDKTGALPADPLGSHSVAGSSSEAAACRVHWLHHRRHADTWRKSREYHGDIMG